MILSPQDGQDGLQLVAGQSALIQDLTSKMDSTPPKTPILMYDMSSKHFYDFCNERLMVYA